ncbi:carbonic anhydrase 2-like [Pollicipes pollicipes]|uniref:carbonic anhydrase 2-like n=1 Tax=Pollicipes pollicipes TaxID=41117 RepID=UPI001884E94D|nr:carbonic anhydrase 2-like [Pollicipes pollicipes]
MPGWGYGSKNGPQTWSRQFPVGEGKRQSPIDIVTEKTRPDPVLETSPLEISYDPSDQQSIGNTGHGWKVDYMGGQSSIRGGPLEGTYALAQYHCHWGREDERGSEHTVDGHKYAAEVRAGCRAMAEQLRWQLSPGHRGGVEMETVHQAQGKS